MTTTKPPYHVGDTIRLLHDSSHGTALADLPVVRVTRLADGRSWRVEARRDHPSCPTVAVVVNEQGVDRHGYVSEKQRTLHLSTSASTVACGTRAYDLGTITVDAARATCPQCLATFSRSAVSS